MLGYISKRLLYFLAVILGASLMTFLLIRVAPGDPAEMIATARYGEENLTVELIESTRQKEKLTDSLAVQYGRWLKDVLHGDLGISITSNDAVSDEINARLPATVKLAITVLICSAVFSTLLGVLASTRYRSLADRILTIGAMLGESIPNFWLSLLLIFFFSVKLHWLPAFGSGTPKHLILPVLSLTVGMTASTMRMTRTSMLESLQQDYIVTARAKGVRRWRIVLRHALKNAMIPTVTMLGMQFSHLIGGTVVVESIFGWPGIGKLLVDAIFARDYPLIQGCVLYYAVFVVVINLLIDFVYVFLDPRIRLKKA